MAQEPAPKSPRKGKGKKGVSKKPKKPKYPPYPLPGAAIEDIEAYIGKNVAGKLKSSLRIMGSQVHLDPPQQLSVLAHCLKKGKADLKALSEQCAKLPPLPGEDKPQSTAANLLLLHSDFVEEVARALAAAYTDRSAELGAALRRRLLKQEEVGMVDSWEPHISWAATVGFTLPPGPLESPLDVDSEDGPATWILSDPAERLGNRLQHAVGAARLEQLGEDLEEAARDCGLRGIGAGAQEEEEMEVEGNIEGETEGDAGARPTVIDPRTVLVGLSASLNVAHRSLPRLLSDALEEVGGHVGTAAGVLAQNTQLFRLTHGALTQAARGVLASAPQEIVQLAQDHTDGVWAETLAILELYEALLAHAHQLMEAQTGGKVEPEPLELPAPDAAEAEAEEGPVSPERGPVEDTEEGPAATFPRASEPGAAEPFSPGRAVGSGHGEGQAPPEQEAEAGVAAEVASATEAEASTDSAAAAPSPPPSPSGPADPPAPPSFAGELPLEPPPGTPWPDDPLPPLGTLEPADPAEPLTPTSQGPSANPRVRHAVILATASLADHDPDAPSQPAAPLPSLDPLDVSLLELPPPQDPAALEESVTAARASIHERGSELASQISGLVSDTWQDFVGTLVAGLSGPFTAAIMASPVYVEQIQRAGAALKDLLLAAAKVISTTVPAAPKQRTQEHISTCLRAAATLPVAFEAAWRVLIDTLGIDLDAAPPEGPGGDEGGEEGQANGQDAAVERRSSRREGGGADVLGESAAAAAGSGDGGAAAFGMLPPRGLPGSDGSGWDVQHSSNPQDLELLAREAEGGESHLAPAPEDAPIPSDPDQEHTTTDASGGPPLSNGALPSAVDPPAPPPPLPAAADILELSGPGPTADAAHIQHLSLLDLESEAERRERQAERIRINIAALARASVAQWQTSALESAVAVLLDAIGWRPLKPAAGVAQILKDVIQLGHAWVHLVFSVSDSVELIPDYLGMYCEFLSEATAEVEKVLKSHRVALPSMRSLKSVRSMKSMKSLNLKRGQSMSRSIYRGLSMGTEASEYMGESPKRALARPAAAERAPVAAAAKPGLGMLGGARAAKPAVDPAWQALASSWPLRAHSALDLEFRSLATVRGGAAEVLRVVGAIRDRAAALSRQHEDTVAAYEAGQGQPAAPGKMPASKVAPVAPWLMSRSEALADAGTALVQSIRLSPLIALLGNWSGFPVAPPTKLVDVSLASVPTARSYAARRRETGAAREMSAAESFFAQQLASVHGAMKVQMDVFSEEVARVLEAL